MFLILVSLCGCDNPTDSVSKNDKIDNITFDDEYEENSTNTNENTIPEHTHHYTSSVTKEATCAEEGVKTYTCSCGDSYTESIPKSKYHDWEYATCTSPKKCKVCGKTEGDVEEHSYSYSDGKCSKCGQINPLVTETLAKCSLALPALPKSLSYYGYSSDKLYTTVNVTNITYKFDCNNDGEISLKLYFSGTKTYDHKGAGQSDSSKIGWKLYNHNNNVVKSGTFYSPNVAEGESFANQEDNAFYSSDNISAGAYRLEINNVN